MKPPVYERSGASPICSYWLRQVHGQWVRPLRRASRQSSREEFGVHKLLLSDNMSGYKDVFFLKHRKKKQWQAKVWRPCHG